MPEKKTKKKTKKKVAKKAPAKKRSAPKTAKKVAAPKKDGAEKTVDAYIGGLRGWQQLVARMLRQCVRRAAPDAKESIKWAQPVYEDNGPFAYFKAFGNTVNFGFWRGADMADPHKLLKGEGEKMRHITMRSPQDLQPQYLEELIREAVALNRSKGDPTKGDDPQ